MSSGKIAINGVEYVRSRDAARAMALSQTTSPASHARARSKAARLWFVGRASLQDFVAEQEASRRRFSAERRIRA
jgi:hypothetical protein